MALRGRPQVSADLDGRPDQAVLRFGRDSQADGLAHTAGHRTAQGEQSATDCRWTWSTVRRGERRVWEVKTGGGNDVTRGDVNQLLGQIEVESKRAAKTRVYGCLLTPAASSKLDAAEAAGDKIALVSHEAAIRLYDVLADRIRQYAALWGDGSAEARGDARTKTETRLPPDGWLQKLLSPTQGRVISADEIAALFPQR